MPRTKPIADAIRALSQSPVHTIVLDYQPGNGTAYHLVITGPYEATEATERVGIDGSYTVTVLNFGTCMTIAGKGGYLSWGYMAEKLGLEQDDAMVLAEIIAKYTGREADDAS